MKRVLALILPIMLLAGCGGSPVRHSKTQTIEGPELASVVERVQQAVDVVLAADVWKPFAEESGHWALACKNAKITANTTCAEVDIAAYAACEASGAGLVAEERCRKIFLGDRSGCGERTQGAFGTWCDLSGVDAACSIQKRAQSVTCDAAKVVPSLVLTGTKIVANVAAERKSDGSVTLLVVNFGGESTVKMSTKVEVSLALRPSRAAYETPSGESWSPRIEVARQQEDQGRKASEDSEAIAKTVLSALAATAARFEWNAEGQRRIVPLRPKAFSFAFDFSVTKSSKGGFLVDLTPKPFKLGAASSSQSSAGNQIVFEFGPEP